MPQLSLSFCGYGATQLLVDYWLWEQLLNETQDLVGIVELGTAYGGFSLYLETQASHRGMFFRTFDCTDHATEPIDRLFGRPDSRPPVAPLGTFQRVELLRNGPAPQVTSWLSRGPVALFCDNGHKAQEVALYAPLLAPGSLCVVHDWLTEIGPEDIPGYLEERYGALCEEISSMSRVFERC
jgi:cephalosporin hydroxylase